jgi:hypothetical protein
MNLAYVRAIPQGEYLSTTFCKLQGTSSIASLGSAPLVLKERELDHIFMEHKAFPI